MDRVILNLLKLQIQLRILHWQTNSHAQHEAFGKAYESLDVLLDTLVENYQGKRGIIKFGSPATIELTNFESISIMDVLHEVTDYLSTEFNNCVDVQKDTDALNIRDEILATLNKLKYLLTLQ
jgi:DNA-binding ferritin-like protein